jgi:hypothetical protein
MPLEVEDIDGMERVFDRLRPATDAHVTRDRVRQYLSVIADTPAPSTAASALRAPVIRELLKHDNVLGPRLSFDANFGNTGSAAILTGGEGSPRSLWYFAHLDTISYLVHPFDGAAYPIVPFCYHMMVDGQCSASAYRYDLAGNAYGLVGTGTLESRQGKPFFKPGAGAPALHPGDRVVPTTPYRETSDTGDFVGHVDNAGGVAALAVAAPVLAAAGVAALFAFPDEEEGPPGSGNQMIGRGGTRIVNLLPTPDLAIVADVQQAGGDAQSDARGGIINSCRIGDGAMLAEFSSLARGAVTPPDLYALARHAVRLMAPLGLRVQESNNAYSSRSDDVGVMLKTPNILLLGFPGLNRHFDKADPSANLDDVVDLAKSLIYLSALRPIFVRRRRALLGQSS